MQFTSNHGIIVNECNELNSTFGIKETTLLRDRFDSFENRDVHFSLHITFNMLEEIIEESNNQLQIEGNLSAKSIYYMEQNEDIALDTNNLLMSSFNIFKDWQNELVEIIKNFEINNNFVSKIKFYRLRFIGCIEPIFRILFKHCDERKIDNSAVIIIKNKIYEVRNNVINVSQSSKIVTVQSKVIKQSSVFEKVSCLC